MLCCVEEELEEIETGIFNHLHQFRLALGSDESVATDLLDFDPGYEESHFKVGLYLFERDMYQEAIFSFKNAIRFDNLELLDRIEATYQCGVAHQELDNVKLAKKWYMKTLTMNEVHFLASYNLGTLYLAEGNPEKAASALTKAHLVEPTDVETLLNLGLAFKQSGETDDSIRCFKSCLQQDEEFIPAFMQLASTYHDMHLFHKATMFYNKALAVEPFNGDALCGLGTCYLDQSDTLNGQLKKKYVKAALHSFLTARDKGCDMEESMVSFTNKSIEFLRAELQTMYAYK